jgi:glycosyltransferase involved in cell wall biosynthesis
VTPRGWIYSDAPYVGGAEHYLRWHLESAGPERLGVVAAAGEGLVPWLDAIEAAGFTVDRLGSNVGLLARVRALRSWCRQRRPRFVHVNMPGPYDGLMALAPAVAKWAGAEAVIVTEHLPSVGRVGKRYWVKRAARSAIDRAIVVSTLHRELMTEVFRYPSDRVTVVVNGVRDPNPERHIAGECHLPLPSILTQQEHRPGARIMQVGSLDARKGGASLLRAFDSVLRAGIDANLWFVGEGPERDLWHRTAVELGIAERVIFTGQVEEAARIWRGADLAVLASEREGLPLSLLEASAWGLPIVATRVDGVPEVVRAGETGWLVESGDERAMAQALREAIVDSAKRARFGRQARARYESCFGFERMLEATFAVYEAVAPGWAS